MAPRRSSLRFAAALLIALHAPVLVARADDAARDRQGAWLQQRLLDPDGTRPFSFTYGGRPSRDLLVAWPRTTAPRALDAARG